MTDGKKPNILKLKLNTPNNNANKSEKLNESINKEKEQSKSVVIKENSEIKKELSKELSYSESLALKKEEKTNPILKGAPQIVHPKVIERTVTRTTTFQRDQRSNFRPFNRERPPFDKTNQNRSGQAEGEGGNPNFQRREWQKPGEGGNPNFQRREWQKPSEGGNPNFQRREWQKPSEGGNPNFQRREWQKPSEGGNPNFQRREWQKPGEGGNPNFQRREWQKPGEGGNPNFQRREWQKTSEGGNPNFQRREWQKPGEGGNPNFQRREWQPGDRSNTFNKDFKGPPRTDRFTQNKFGETKPFNTFNRPKFGENRPFNRPQNQSTGPQRFGLSKTLTSTLTRNFSKPTNFFPAPFIEQKRQFEPDRRKKRTTEHDDKFKNQKGYSRDNVGINVTNFVGRVDSGHLEAHSFNDPFARKRREKPKSDIFIKHDIEISGPMSIKDIATKMAMRSTQVLSVAKKLGLNTNDKENISEDILHIIVEECGHNPIRLDEKNKAQLEFPKLELDDAKAKPRGPVVVVVGHVDHGKTSLLDRIRKSSVAKKEAGGITQSIGAYQVKLKEGIITFIDTPGHEAFTSMRSRGVNITDIAILVVSAEDSIKPQTVEAISHIKAANVPIIVAITKADLHTANIEKVKTDLLSHGIVPEEFGGNTPCIPVSSITGLNIDKLLETILLQAEVMELKANEDVEARGVVLESKINPKIGAIATLLIQQGTLKASSFCIANISSGKIKVMHDADGKVIKEAKPGMPVEVIGFDVPPPAGSEFAQISNAKIANDILNARILKHSQETKSAGINMSLSFENFASESKPSINLILRTDTQGSLEALKYALTKLNSSASEAKFILAGVGPIKESDIDLAVISGANIVNFNQKTPSVIKKLADERKITIFENAIIYNLIESIESQLLGLIAPEEKETMIGVARVLKIFSSSKIGNIAGCIVVSGMMKNGFIAKVVRAGKMIATTKIKSLKRGKDDVKEVNNNIECGIVLDKFDSFMLDDEIQCYKIELIS